MSVSVVSSDSVFQPNYVGYTQLVLEELFDFFLLKASISPKGKPADATIIAVVDTIEKDGKLTYQKYEAAE